MRTFIAAFFLIPLLALVPAQQAEGPASPPAAAVVLAAPAVASSTALQSDLERLIHSPGWRGDRWSVMVVSLDKGDTLFNHGADEAMMPASNLKLFSTAAALYYLGPQFRYNTFLLSDGKIENGVLNGDVVIYGTGDPTFSTRFGRRDEVWHAFADTLAALGVKEIHGNIIGDASYFKGPGNGSGWQEAYINASYAAPASALTYAENIATLQIRPGIAPGMKPDVSLLDGATGFELVNEATTVARGRSWISATRTSYDGPIIVRGQISRGTVSILRTIPVADPAQYSAAVFRQILIDDSIKVTGAPKSVTDESQSPVSGRLVFAPALDSKPPVRVLAMHQSPPLLEIVDVINKKSHNLMAEQAIRTVGRIAGGEGSVAAGFKAVEQLFQRESGTGPEVLTMDDGCGLSILDRTSARTMIHLLSFMSKTPVFDAYYSTLPEAGVIGGLRRMYGTKAQANLKAKTGTINNVSALSGYVRASDGEHLAFSIISNNVPSTSRAKRVEDAIGARLASYDRNNDVTIAPTPEPTSKASKSRGRGYTVKRGDTLGGIARKNHTTVAKLQRANPGLSTKRLQPGKRIKLP